MEKTRIKYVIRILVKVIILGCQINMELLITKVI